MQGFRFHVSHKSHPFMVWRSSSPAMRLSSVAEPQLLELLFILARLALQNRPNAGDEPSWNPVSEPIVDYWIDSGLGPGYSPL
jgi:hypothetical protein